MTLKSYRIKATKKSNHSSQNIATRFLLLLVNREMKLILSQFTSSHVIVRCRLHNCPKNKQKRTKTSSNRPSSRNAHSRNSCFANDPRTNQRAANKSRDNSSESNSSRTGFKFQPSSGQFQSYDFNSQSRDSSATSIFSAKLLYPRRRVPV